MKVLMLGWEFPPLLNGGLGIATYGIVKALSNKVDIHLILPKAEKTIHANYKVSGLNHLTENEITEEWLHHNSEEFVTALSRLPISISPYHFQNSTLIENHKTDSYNDCITTEEVVQKINETFSSTDVYGPNIVSKVYLFATLALEVSTKIDFDIIHAHDWVTFLAGVYIKQRSGKPLILHVHALETDRAGEEIRNEIFRLEEKTLRQADLIFSVSEYTKNQIIQHYKIDASKIEVIHNGIDRKPIKHNTHKLNQKLVVFLGRITHQKGPEFLLETAEKVSRVYPNVKFVVAGMGDLFTNLLETAAYKKLGRKFIFTGFLTQEKVNELLSMADVYFMPSVSEPFGLSALEAAQHEVPGVISLQSGAAEVLKSSLKADFWDTDKYANYIYALLKYPVLSKTVASQMHEESKEATWDHAAEKIYTFYKNLVR